MTFEALGAEIDALWDRLQGKFAQIDEKIRVCDEEQSEGRTGLDAVTAAKKLAAEADSIRETLLTKIDQAIQMCAP